MDNPIYTETFGGYTDSDQEIFEQALRWVKEHPNANILNGLLYSDEGHYMTIYWEYQTHSYQGGG